MYKRALSIQVSGTIGSVSAECMVPKDSCCIMTLAHGAGAGMNHPFMIELTEALSKHAIATLRFNFPFMENKKGRPDSPVIAHQAIEAALANAGKLFPGLPLFAAGKSFGGRMISQCLALHADPVVKGIVFYGFPLHPAGKPSIERAEHLKNVKQPMLFLQGTKDELAKWNLIESVCASLKRARLIKIDGANHAFKAGKQPVITLLANETHDWIKKTIRKK